MASQQRFDSDVANHVMEIIRDEGVNRHLRFRKPGTMCMHFDLITWPGYLCYTGDMGTYVFRRTEDMLGFFRAAGSRPNPQYWHEKVEAADKSDGVREFDPEAFTREITKQRRRMLVDFTRKWATEGRQELWESLQEVIDSAHDGEAHTITAVQDWSYRVTNERGAFIRQLHLDTDDFPSCKRFTFRYMWCCRALVWAIGVYDAQTNATRTPAEATP